ncbi:MAG: class I mannose-6-phosphate isomerase [Prevotellaceae bacterium]|jgi:mannose-6-phosphate isomerase class I|nr:class I mannose-6-phosphate isomerase [Prevotellaceae bacterium]
MKNNYEKKPAVKVDGLLVKGWDAILAIIKSLETSSHIIVIDCYTGVFYDDLKSKFEQIENTLFIDTLSLFKSESAIKKMTSGFMTDDVLFGYLTNLSIHDYFDTQKLTEVRARIQSNKGVTVVFGHGAGIVACGDLTIYADMPRWKIQQRMRKNKVTGLGVDNRGEQFSLQYKRGLFNDWKVCDAHKCTMYERVDYWLDTSIDDEPKLLDKATFFRGIEKAASSPFRVAPFFDPAPWGGQWMKEVCDLDRSVVNFGWCFDCVPEENSLMLEVEGTVFEMPSVNLVYLQSTALLGEPVEARFGKEFPIRFDFLDTMGGGNLSLQVHPTTQYVHDNFGIHYTQDESYYLLDAGKDATVFLGLKSGIDKNAMIEDLRKAQNSDFVFDAEKYVNILPAKKHDHFLIPGGTIHCSGSNSVVLEISSTPNLFTFKLWDWQRLDLDGKPRPINVERGKDVIQWNRDTEYTQKYLVNNVSAIAEGDGWKEEKTGLHKNEFIETRRHIFTKVVKHATHDSVNVLNLVEGCEVIVESPEGRFEPFVVHYAETFIIPAAVGEYTIRPYGEAEGKQCTTIKAFVRV